jgi:hypothetical protein
MTWCDADHRFYGDHWVITAYNGTVYNVQVILWGPRRPKYYRRLLLPLTTCYYFYNTYDIDQRHFGVDAGMLSSPQITNRGRVEIGAGAYTATLYVMVNIVKGGGRAGATPHPLQPRLFFPS